MIVGLTGGIGSGKTTVAKIFAHLGVPVYEADAASKNIIDTNKELQGRLLKLTGPGLLKNGLIDRPYLANLIFNDRDLLQKVNAIIHPAVAEDFLKWYKAQNFPYVIKEAAILFESGTYRQCDKIIVVAAPREMRIEWVMKRSGVSREEVWARMKNQWPEEQKVEMADYVIHNDLQQSVIKQAIEIHENIIRTADKGSR